MRRATSSPPLLDIDANIDLLCFTLYQVSDTRSPRTSTHNVDEDKEISIFVQDIDDRKPLSGRMKERESSTRREREYQEHMREGTDTTVKGKGRAYGASDLSDTGVPYTTSPVEGVLSPTSPRGTQSVTTSADAKSPSVATSPGAYLSTSPQRGPMLTTEYEVDERLRRMNENFLRSLEGISEGSVRRKKDSGQAHDSSTTNPDAGQHSPVHSPVQSSVTGAPVDRQRSGSLRARLALDSNSTATPFSQTTVPTSRQALRSPDRLDNIPGARLHAESPTRGTPVERDAYVYTTGLGLGLPARARRASTSSSTFGTSEAGASQGSEEVIGRMDLDGDRRRWGYGFAPP